MIDNLPFEWSSGNWYFFTYYGDVYYGAAFQLDNNSDSFFIISPNKQREYFSLKKEERTPEKYRTLGWEIFNPNVIVEAVSVGQNQKLGGKTKHFTHSKSHGKRYKKMFVFGAGASRFCTFNKYHEQNKGTGDDQDADRLSKFAYRPPLGNEVFHNMFDDIIEHYPGVTNSLSVYEDAGSDIEKMLEIEWQSIHKSKRIDILKRHINVQYYMQSLMRKVSVEVNKSFFRRNLYALLSSKLKNYYANHTNEKAAFVSFNYDTILDYNLEQQFDYSFETIHDYINYQNDFVLLKPHGSSNWGWRLTEEARQEVGGKPYARHFYDQKYNLFDFYFKLLGDYKENLSENTWGTEMFLNPNQLGRLTIDKNNIEVQGTTNLYYPAMLLPHSDKDEFVMPYEHMHTLDIVAKDVEELYLIGWKGSEELFNTKLNNKLNNLKRIVIVNPDENKDQSISKELKRFSKYKEAEIEVVENFEVFVREEFDKYFN